MAAARGIPAVTAALSQLVVPEAIMPLEQSMFNRVGLIQFVRAVHGHVTGHILVMQAWDVDHMLTVVISAIFVSLAAAAAGCVMEMLGVQDTTTVVVLTVISADSSALI